MAEEAVEPTGRERLAALMSELQADERDAMDELAAYLDSAAGKAFAAKVSALHIRTVPGSRYDQTTGNVLAVLSAMRQVAGTVEPIATPMLASPTPA